jgi:hypothetical protein
MPDAPLPHHETGPSAAGYRGGATRRDVRVDQGIGGVPRLGVGGREELGRRGTVDGDVGELDRPLEERRGRILPRRVFERRKLDDRMPLDQALVRHDLAIDRAERQRAAEGCILPQVQAKERVAKRSVVRETAEDGLAQAGRVVERAGEGREPRRAEAKDASNVLGRERDVGAVDEADDLVVDRQPAGLRTDDAAPSNAFPGREAARDRPVGELALEAAAVGIDQRKGLAPVRVVKLDVGCRGRGVVLKDGRR